MITSTLLLTNADFPDWVTCHVRDPQMLRQDGQVLMLLGARTQADEGCLLVYASGDGVHFRHVHTVRTPEPFGYMWECPDYACLNGQQLLLCSPQGIPHQAYEYQNAHQCGCLELTGRLDADAAAGAFHSFDYGFDFYAVRSLRAADGRTLLIAWMGMSEADYGRTPAAGHGWDQVIALPRELTWENGRPCQRPLRELRALRGECQAAGCDAGAAWDSRRCELVLHPQPGQDVSLHLFEDGLLSYDAAGSSGRAAAWPPRPLPAGQNFIPCAPLLLKTAGNMVYNQSKDTHRGQARRSGPLFHVSATG